MMTGAHNQRSEMRDYGLSATNCLFIERRCAQVPSYIPDVDYSEPLQFVYNPALSFCHSSLLSTD
jgi:hypothetical protein